MNIKPNASLRAWNSFAVDARASYLVKLNSRTQIPELLDFPGREPRTLVLGGGSNILFRSDFDGLVLINELKGKRLIEENANSILLEVGAGENWHVLVRWSIEQGYYGLENLSLIPGSVGAAPIQNIGAYGVELERFFVSLDAVELSSGEPVRYDRQQCRFSYRDSLFKSEPDRFLITSVRLRLDKTFKPELNYTGIRQVLVQQGADPDRPGALQVSDAICKLRNSKLPAPRIVGNAGSFFKNPVVGEEKYSNLKVNHPRMPGFHLPGYGRKIPAAWLIEQCGWKGYRAGDAGVYDHHALVLVNYGAASGEELYRLSEKIRDSVEDKFGIRLEPEPRII